MNEGYFPLWRKFKNHKFWLEKRKYSFFEAWLDILTEARYNEEPNDVQIGYLTIKCEKGECVKSLNTWAARWGWDKSRVRRFLKMLQDDNMIVTKSELKTTRITIVNYDAYNNLRNANDTQVKRKRHASDTQMTPKEERNKDNIYIPPISPPPDSCVSEKHKYGDFVFLTIQEHDRLIEFYGERRAQELIDELNEGIGSKGYKYKSHFYTICSWARKRGVNRIDQKPEPASQPTPQLSAEPEYDIDGFNCFLETDEKRKKIQTWYEKNVLPIIEDAINEQSYDTWFKESQAIMAEKGTLFVYVEKMYMEDWIETNYRHVIDNAIELAHRKSREPDKTPCKIEYTAKIPEKFKIMEEVANV